MTKRGYVRALSFTFAAILVLAGLAGINMYKANAYKSRLESSYQHSLNELAENLDAIETNLTKSVYSGSDKMLTEISGDLFAECNEAKDALSRLPVEQMNLGSTYKFISQAADYSAYLAGKLAQKDEITDEEHENLGKLLEYSAQLRDSVNSMIAVCNSGGEITSSGVRGDSIKINAISADMSEAEKTFKDYPTLLYDGPFADSVLNRESSLLKTAKEIDREEAREIASKALGVNISELSFDGEKDGKLPSYVFSHGQRSIGVTRRGGYVSYILYGGKITGSQISEKSAVGTAEKYLETLGYKNMKSSYYAINGNVCVINFAYTKDGVTYYSDLIKVGIAMNNGRVVSLEADGYLVNHRERGEFRAKLKKSDAQKKLSKYLSVIGSKKCVIPLENGTESQCFEFHCRSKETGEEVLVYINASTGAEDNILLLLYSDSGTLTK
jgi:germination protein YpeB